MDEKAKASDLVAFLSSKSILSTTILCDLNEGKAQHFVSLRILPVTLISVTQNHAMNSEWSHNPKAGLVERQLICQGKEVSQMDYSPPLPQPRGYFCLGLKSSDRLTSPLKLLKAQTVSVNLHLCTDEDESVSDQKGEMLWKQELGHSSRACDPWHFHKGWEAQHKADNSRLRNQNADGWGSQSTSKHYRRENTDGKNSRIRLSFRGEGQIPFCSLVLALCKRNPEINQ